eukprot:10728343-Alexandrium_andersonii.AAC.1
MPSGAVSRCPCRGTARTRSAGTKMDPSRAPCKRRSEPSSPNLACHKEGTAIWRLPPGSP